MHRRSLSLSIFEVVYLRITLFLCFCRFTILVVSLWVLTAFKALASHARRCFMNIQFISVLCFVFIWTSNTPRRTFASVRHHVRRLQAGHIIVACRIGNTPLEPVLWYPIRFLGCGLLLSINAPLCQFRSSCQSWSRWRALMRMGQLRRFLAAVIAAFWAVVLLIRKIHSVFCVCCAPTGSHQ